MGCKFKKASNSSLVRKGGIVANTEKSWKDICALCEYNRTHYVHSEKHFGEPYMNIECHEFVEKIEKGVTCDS